MVMKFIWIKTSCDASCAISSTQDFACDTSVKHNSDIILSGSNYLITTLANIHSICDTTSRKGSSSRMSRLQMSRPFNKCSSKRKYPKFHHPPRLLWNWQTRRSTSTGHIGSLKWPARVIFPGVHRSLKINVIQKVRRTWRIGIWTSKLLLYDDERVHFYIYSLKHENFA